VCANNRGRVAGRAVNVRDQDMSVVRWLLATRALTRCSPAKMRTTKATREGPPLILVEHGSSSLSYKMVASPCVSPRHMAFSALHPTSSPATTLNLGECLGFRNSLNDAVR